MWQSPEDVLCVPVRHILIYAPLWYGRYQSFFYVPYEVNNEFEIRLGWAQVRHTDTLGSVVGMGSVTASSHICFGIVLGFVFYTQTYFFLIEDLSLIILRRLS